MDHWPCWTVGAYSRKGRGRVRGQCGMVARQQRVRHAAEHFAGSRNRKTVPPTPNPLSLSLPFMPFGPRWPSWPRQKPLGAVSQPGTRPFAGWSARDRARSRDEERGTTGNSDGGGWVWAVLKIPKILATLSICSLTLSTAHRR